LRWVKPKNLHITLVPPWQSEGIEAISHKLKAISFTPFEIKFESISFGPNKNDPKLIWASGTATKEILDLRLKIYEALGQKADERPFRLHMTLARLPFDFAPSTPLGSFAQDILRFLPENVKWRMVVDRFVLYESLLKPEGAEYEVLEEFRLE